MKNFKIAFQDEQDNEVYSVTKKFDDWRDASHYAKLILANTSDECVYFSVIEITT